MNKHTLQPASFGERFLAFFIDNIILSIAIAPILLMLFGRKTLTDEQLEAILQSQGIIGLFTPAEIITSNLLGLVVTGFFWVRFAGTPMKRFLGLRVIDAKTGNNLTPAQSAIRYFGYFLSYLPMGMGFIWAAFDKDKQAWHDKIAGTIVVKDNTRHQRSTLHSTNRESPIQKNDDDTFAA